jgi:hypothetical protein
MEHRTVVSKNQLSAFEHLVLSIFPGNGEGCQMAMFDLALYFDDSGTHPKSDIAVAACYVATVEQWKEFERNWKEANDRFHFGIFHMVDFVAKKEQFSDKDAWTDPVRASLIRQLISIIKVRTRIGFCAAVFKSDYDAVMPDDLKERMGRFHYTFAVRQCLSMIQKWREDFNLTAPMQYVFEDGTKGRGEILTTFDKVSGDERATKEFGFVPGGYSFIPKTENLPQLQAPDILAWESGWHMKNTVAPDKRAGRPKRTSFKVLCDSPLKLSFFHAGNLQKLVEKMRASDEQRGIETIGVSVSE